MQETYETSALASGEAQTSWKCLREAAWLRGSLISHPAAVLCQSDTATLGCVCQKRAGTSLSHFPPGGFSSFLQLQESHHTTTGHTECLLNLWKE